MKKSTILATIILFSLLQNAQALDTNLEWDNYGIPWHRNSEDEDDMEGIDWQALGDETNPIHDDGYGSNQDAYDEDYDIDPQDLGDASNPTDEDDEDEDIPTLEGFDYTGNHLADDQDKDDEDSDDNVPTLEGFDYSGNHLADDQDEEDDEDEESLANNGWVIVEKSDADGYDQ